MGFYNSQLAAIDPVWCAPVPEASTCLTVQIRAHGDAVPCRVSTAGSQGFAIDLTEPIHGVAPGQSAVLYDLDRVVGQGTIRLG